MINRELLLSCINNTAPWTVVHFIMSTNAQTYCQTQEQTIERFKKSAVSKYIDFDMLTKNIGAYPEPIPETFASTKPEPIPETFASTKPETTPETFASTKPETTPTIPNILEPVKSINRHITKNFDCSTAHIRFKDNSNLQFEPFKPIASLIVYPYKEGFFVYVPQIDFEEALKTLSEYSSEFRYLLCIAHDKDCKFLHLDRDGETYEDLPTFDW
jgi:hypothetical protein